MAISPYGVEAIVKTSGFLGVKPWDIDMRYRRISRRWAKPQLFKEMVTQLDDKQDHTSA